jgi:hypothetical protein
MKCPLRLDGLVLATLVLIGTASVGYAASPALAATGPHVTVQINLPEGKLAGENIQIGAANEPPVVAGITNGELSKIECGSGLGEGELPPNSVGAALLALSGGELSITGLHGNGTLTFEGEELPMESISFKKPGPGEPDEGWQLWVGERYYDLGLGVSIAFCSTVQEGETVLLQGSELVATSSPSSPAPYSADTPHIQIEGVPASVVVGQRFTVTVAAFEPSEWDENAPGPFSEIWRTTGSGYSVSLDGRIPAQTNANGEATLTATAEDAGEASLVARAGDSPSKQLPTTEGNSALSVPVGLQVHGQAGELSAPSADFGTQALDTTGAPQSIVVAAAGGGAQITGVEVTGPDAEDFLVSSNKCTGKTVNSETQSTCAVGVRFSPSAEGSRGATLVVSSTAAEGALEVPFIGSGGTLPAGAPGQAGVQGATGAQGGEGPAGQNGMPGPQGTSGAIGPRGSAGRDAVCTVKHGKKTPHITCTLKAHGARATLTRAGRTYARGTVASLRATRAVPAGHYTLHYSVASNTFTVAITLR